MLNRIHRRLGTAGFVISIVALIAALGGGAYAASGGLSGKQKKEVEKIAKKYAGKPGATGATGPAGAPGAPGAKGDKGDKGDPGVNGANGTNGANGLTGFTKTLPSGDTETGAWNITQFVGTASTPPSLTAISFPIPLEAPAETWVFTEGQTENEKFGKDETTRAACVLGTPECEPTGCEGTLAQPKAAPGVLCIYTTAERLEHITNETLLAKNFVGGPARESSVSGANLAGYTFAGTAAEPAEAIVYGTWAVTAP